MRTVTIPATELAALRRKEIAHDDYLHALRLSQKRLALHRATIVGKPPKPISTGWVRGYQEALTDLAQFIADAAAERLAEAAMVHRAGASELFDRGVPEL